jgi:DNA-binding NtrC family response regulator
MKEKNFSILIVDDDFGVTVTLADILDDLGYAVAVTGDGYRAIEMVRESNYDVALMDIEMSKINGLEIFRKVKHISPLTRVMMMSTYSVGDLVREALKEGAYGILYKPLDLDKVLYFIEKAERSERLSRAGAGK